MRTKLILLASVLAATTSLAAQQYSVTAQDPTLADMAKEAGVDWILGEWVSTGGGAQVTVSFATICEGHAVKHESSDGTIKNTALIAYDADSQTVKHFSISNIGVLATGEWTVENEKVVLREQTASGPHGSAKLAWIFARTADNTMTMDLCTRDDSGAIQEPAVMSFNLQRKK